MSEKTVDALATAFEAANVVLKAGYVEIAAPHGAEAVTLMKKAI